MVVQSLVTISSAGAELFIHDIDSLIMYLYAALSLQLKAELIFTALSCVIRTQIALNHSEAVRLDL